MTRPESLLAVAKENNLTPEMTDKQQAFAGLLFDFMGFLTTHEKRWKFSAYDDATPGVQAIEQFAEMRGLSLDDPNIKGWLSHLSDAQKTAAEKKYGFATPTDNAVNAGAVPSDGETIYQFQPKDRAVWMDLPRHKYESRTPDQKWRVLYKQPKTPTDDEVNQALFEVDDFIARVNGDDRGSCHSVNVLRAALTTKADSFDGVARMCRKCGQLHVNAGAVPSDALADFLEAQDALDNHELNGQNGTDYFTLVRRRNVARKDLDAAITAQPQADAGVSTLYSELLFAVGNKYPGESRHQTALRYLRQAERSREPLMIKVINEWAAKRARAAGGEISNIPDFVEEVVRWTEEKHGISPAPKEQGNG